MVMLVLAIPLALCVVGVVTYRGVYRAIALLPTVILAAALGLDSVSFAQNGNLTGLFTMIATIPALVILLIASILQGVSSLRRRAKATPTEPVDLNPSL